MQKKNFNLSAQFRWKNGYSIPKVKATGIGKSALDVDTVLYGEKFDIAGYVLV